MKEIRKHISNTCFFSPWVEIGEIVRARNSRSRQGFTPSILLKFSQHVQWHMVFRKPQFAIFILIAFCFQDIFCHAHRKMLLVGKLKRVSYLIVNYFFITDYSISEGRKVSIRTFSIWRNLIWRDEFLPSNVGIKISNLNKGILGSLLK